MNITRTRSPQEIWETALGELQIQVSQPNYRTWFGKTTGLSYTDNRFVIGVPNTFAAEYLDKNQRSLIEKVLIGLVAAEVEVVFQVNGRHHSHEGENSSLAGDAAPAPAFTRLNPRNSFDHFIEGAGNRLARTAAETQQPAE